MLNVKNDRLDYGELLMPPVGFKLVKAVATTYSLDLQCLMAIPIALFYSKTLDGDYEQFRLDVLDSIQKASESIIIYCQKGKIHVPSRFNNLYANIEKSIVQVKPNTAFSSFHPKLWILRYENDKSEFEYQLMVTSRNMTFDRSQDIAIYLFGKTQNSKQFENTPLIHLLKELTKVQDFEASDKFIEGLSFTKFDCPDGFESFKFHPIGIPLADKIYENPIMDNSFSDMFIISPFIDNKTLDKISGIANYRILISRKEEIQKIDKDIIERFLCYYLSDDIVYKEFQEDLSEPHTSAQIQDIHAKLFVGSGNGSCKWYIGSANCTQPAFNRNVEFLLELISNSNQTSFNALYNDLLGDSSLSIFEKYIPNSTVPIQLDDSSIIDIRKLEYLIISADIIGSVSQNENKSNFDLHISIDFNNIFFEKGIEVLIRPMIEKVAYIKCKPGIHNEFDYPNIREIDLTNFFIVSIIANGDTIRSFVLKSDIVFPETRLSRILKSIIDNSDKFFQYLMFLLADNPYDIDPVIPPGNKTRKIKNQQAMFSEDTPLLEQLLVTASRNPKKFNSIEKLVNKLKDEKLDDGQPLVPSDFLDLWSIFKSINNNRKQ